MPPVPAFYYQPSTIKEVVDQTLNRALDLVGVELAHELFPRWEGPNSALRQAVSNGQEKHTGPPCLVGSHSHSA